MPFSNRELLGKNLRQVPKVTLRDTDILDYISVYASVTAT